ncbi:hypothetical protein [Eleftheria terrae]|uniref:hypothetical protein n=1 Tax=Eleftheria terrae TaxID=1597781 RepID=UPI00263B7C00|nr:hypothetical protein [Eleftheria terrae]WKB53556.1 hypothetical protein N7L95_03920 [Eleftheria terrae]
MTRIVARLESPADLVQAAFFIHRLTGAPLLQSRRRLQCGAVVVEFLLFHNDHTVVAQQLRYLIAHAPGFGRLRLYELGDDPATCVDPDDPREIAAATALQLLARFERDLARCVG